MDQKILKASFRDCPVGERKLFPYSKCILPISVGYNFFEGDKLIAFFKLINRSFESCLIQVDDSIQRHTLKIFAPLDDQAAYEEAIRLGDDWLSRNAMALEVLKIPVSTKRWDVWLEHSEFSECYDRIEALYAEKKLFEAAFLKTATDFCQRGVAHYPEKNIDQERAMNLCIKYLKEECAVMCLWVYEQCQFEVYPSRRTEAMQATYDYLIKPLHSDLLRPVAIRYKKY